MADLTANSTGFEKNDKVLFNPQINPRLAATHDFRGHKHSSILYQLGNDELPRFEEGLEELLRRAKGVPFSVRGFNVTPQSWKYNNGPEYPAFSLLHIMELNPADKFEYKYPGGSMCGLCDWFTHPSWLVPFTDDVCTCDSIVFLQAGCKCGFVEREKEKAWRG